MLNGYTGFANMWEMDENNHLNVQFYMDWFHQSLDIIAIDLGHGPAMAQAQQSQLRGVEDRITYLREVRGADTVVIKTMMVAVEEKALTLLHVMENDSTGEVAATNLQLVHLIGVDDFTPRPLSDDIREQATKYLETPDATLMPRHMDLLLDKVAPTTADAKKVGLFEAGRSVVQAQELDWTGRMRARFALGRGSDSASLQWKNVGIDVNHLDGNTGSVVMQTIMRHHNAPRLGTPVKAQAGLHALGNKTLQFAQWISDMETGEVYTTSDTIAVQFDQTARKALPISDEQRAALSKNLLKI
ncbi:MAG: acyl-CoA thioesterase [Alphaproteobacteria bacterium]